jgi:hypothetical protein
MLTNDRSGFIFPIRIDSFATSAEQGKRHRKFHLVNHGEAVVQIKRVCFRKGTLGFLSLCTEENRAQPAPSQSKGTWPVSCGGPAPTAWTPTRSSLFAVQGEDIEGNAELDWPLWVVPAGKVGGTVVCWVS